MRHARIVLAALLVMSAFASVGHAQTASPQSGTPQSSGGKTPRNRARILRSRQSSSPPLPEPQQSSAAVSLSTRSVLMRSPSTRHASTAEIFRNIPGIRSEAGGGNAGNANIIVRGLPAASGGAKFLQLHEDGLPVLEFGDIAFGNADIFLRSDWSVERVESVRGGSASTFASNSPGGVINFISNTGERPVSRLGYMKGVDFDWDQMDFEYGGPISERWRGHIAGYARREKVQRTPVSRPIRAIR